MLSQTQTIRALADALEWFEKELGWGVQPAALGHLTGRIGELFVAVMSGGQMADRAMTPGYDVIGADGERISVKTVTTSSHVTFNANTLSEVDRVIVLRITVDETEPSIEELLDCPVGELAPRCSLNSGKLRLPLPLIPAEARPLSQLRVVDRARFRSREILQYENSTIAVLENGVAVPVTKPVLREIARFVGVDLLNANGNPKNTRTLGAHVIAALKASDTPVPARAADTGAQSSQVGETERMARNIHACLIGGAVGDALGAEIEFWTLDQVRAAFPEGIFDLPPHQGLVGAITDDTQMTLFTAEGLIRAMVRQASKGICSVPAVVHHALLRWLATQGETAPALSAAYPDGGEPIGLVNDPRLKHRRAPGLTCLQALKAAEQFGQPARNSSKGCGTIMRVAPLAFVAPDLIRPLAEECSGLTHGHPAGQQAAAAWALILNDLASGLDIEAAAARQVGAFGPDVNRCLRAALDARRDGLPMTLQTLGGGWVAEEALAIALYACLTADDFESGLVTAVYHGGDSDSTGAIAGNALGLMFPDQALAHRWSGQVECGDLIGDLSQALAFGTFENPELLWDRYPGW